MHMCRWLTPLVSAHLIGCQFIPQFRNDFRVKTSMSSSLEVHNRHLFTQYKPTDPVAHIYSCVSKLFTFGMFAALLSVQCFISGCYVQSKGCSYISTFTQTDNLLVCLAGKLVSFTFFLIVIFPHSFPPPANSEWFKANRVSAPLLLSICFPLFCSFSLQDTVQVTGPKYVFFFFSRSTRLFPSEQFIGLEDIIQNSVTAISVNSVYHSRCTQ